MKPLRTLVILSALFLAGPAAAQLYVGGGVGEARPYPGEGSWKVFAGMQLTKSLGIEAGYLDLGNYHGTDVESWSLAATGTMALNDRWSLIGKVGGHRLHFGNTKSDTELLLGAGIAYLASQNLWVRLEYEDLGSPTNPGFGNGTEVSNLGINLHFGF